MQSHRSPTIINHDALVAEKDSERRAVVPSGKKFMLTLRPAVFEALRRVADQRGVTVQGLIRAVIVPEWHLEHRIGSMRSQEAEERIAERDRMFQQSSPLQDWHASRGKVQNVELRKVTTHG